MRFRLKSLLAFVALTVIVLSTAPRIERLMSDRFLRSRQVGVLVSPSSWPLSIQELVRESRTADAECILQDCTVYQCNDVDFILRASSTECSISWLCNSLGLRAIDQRDPMVAKMSRLLPCEWREGVAETRNQYYLSTGWSEGEEGDLYLLQVQQGGSRLLIWYYFNF
jgi:hypothetical protein